MNKKTIIFQLLNFDDIEKLLNQVFVNANEYYFENARDAISVCEVLLSVSF